MKVMHDLVSKAWNSGVSVIDGCSMVFKGILACPQQQQG